MSIQRALKILAITTPWLIATLWAAGDATSKEPAQKREAATNVFNVLDYGAVADDKTDNTEAFSKCVSVIIAAGGGRMVIPDGIYRGRIIIPGTKNWITMEIVGGSEPTPVFGTIGRFPFPTKGPIIKCLAKNGKAVIVAENTPESLYGGFSGVNVVIRNLDVRTYDNPGISGIDLKLAAQCKLENVFVNTDIYNVQASQPTTPSCGIITPACNNAASTILRNVVVTGYHDGIVVNEHTDGANIVVASNVNGLRFDTAHHASHFARVGAARNTHHLAVSGRHAFSIAQLDTEMPGKGQTDAANAWQTLISDVEDPHNLGIGELSYWVVLGGTGAVDQFVKNGGTGILARRIGMPPLCAEEAPSKPALPNVLIIGDSISNGYTPFVKTLLNGKANVAHNPGNAQYTGTGLKRIEEWLGTTQWDVIHFNWGLWDMYGWEYLNEDRSPAMYEKRLEELVSRLKKTGAKLIWATTTPPCPAPEVSMVKRFNGPTVIDEATESQYLEAAKRVMTKHQIPINDLRALIISDRKRYALGDNDVHFTKEGYEMLGQQVAEQIEKHLTAKTSGK